VGYRNDTPSSTSSGRLQETRFINRADLLRLIVNSTLPGAQEFEIGVPYGSRARLIMLYLMGRALETSCREVELGRSLRDWLVRIGIPQGGKSIRDVREQAERISRCRLSFQVQQGGRTGLVNQNIVDSAIFLDNSDPTSGSHRRRSDPSDQQALYGLGSVLLASIPAARPPGCH
jgi:hypothetical protein